MSSNETPEIQLDLSEEDPIEHLALQFDRFQRRIDNELEEVKKELAEIKETLKPKIITVNKPCTPDYDLKVVSELDEDLEEELIKLTPPRRPAPRVSISNWSEQRKKNNMSVRSVVSSLERKKA